MRPDRTPSAQRRRSWRGSSLPLLGALLQISCLDSQPAPHRGPVVLITLDGLRADVVGSLGGLPGLTPMLDSLVAGADWAGPAVSTSSWTVPATASLFTGLQPWQHGALHGDRAELRRELHTLPEALGRVGFATFAYRSNYWCSSAFGYQQGFTSFRRLGSGLAAAGHLESLDGDEEFVWIQLAAPAPPFRRVQALLPALSRALGEEVSAGALPETVGLSEIEPYFDPARELPESERSRFWRAYLLNVAWADFLLGRQLDALRRSGIWERAILVVTSTHGVAIGEYGQVGVGGSLGRRLIEVPLVLKLPPPLASRLRIPQQQRPSLAQLWATLVEAVGGRSLPAAAPSLFRDGTHGVLSELYRANGVNRFSWLRADRQLHWESRFAEDEEEYYAARLVRGGHAAAAPLHEPAPDVFARLGRRLRAAPPLSGVDGSPRLRLELWTAEGSAPLRDAELEAQMAEELRAAWMRFQQEERPLPD